jgi:hypothetical protein
MSNRTKKIVITLAKYGAVLAVGMLTISRLVPNYSNMPKVVPTPTPEVIRITPLPIPAVTIKAESIPQASASAQLLKTGGAVKEASSSGRYPDAKVTPGDGVIIAIDLMCLPGYGKDKSSISEATKKKVYAAYGLVYPDDDGKYAIDHLVPVQLGGLNSMKNLWPQAVKPVPGFNEKNKAEDYLYAQVCAGKISQAEAQQQIKKDWVKVWNKT